MSPPEGSQAPVESRGTQHNSFAHARRTAQTADGDPSSIWNSLIRPPTAQLQKSNVLASSIGLGHAAQAGSQKPAASGTVTPTDD